MPLSNGTTKHEEDDMKAEGNVYADEDHCASREDSHLVP